MKRWMLLLSLVAACGVSACSRAAAGTAASPPPGETEAAEAAVAPEQAAAASEEGAALLQSACTTCHDLSAITGNPGVYTEAEFRDTVQRMVGYGAPVDQDQVEVLVTYLTETYGR